MNKFLRLRKIFNPELKYKTIISPCFSYNIRYPNNYFGKKNINYNKFKNEDPKNILNNEDIGVVASIFYI